MSSITFFVIVFTFLTSYISGAFAFTSSIGQACVCVPSLWETFCDNMFWGFFGISVLMNLWLFCAKYPAQAASFANIVMSVLAWAGQFEPKQKRTNALERQRITHEMTVENSARDLAAARIAQIEEEHLAELQSKEEEKREAVKAAVADYKKLLRQTNDQRDEDVRILIYGSDGWQKRATRAEKQLADRNRLADRVQELEGDVAAANKRLEELKQGHQNELDGVMEGWRKACVDKYEEEMELMRNHIHLLEEQFDESIFTPEGQAQFQKIIKAAERKKYESWRNEVMAKTKETLAAADALTTFLDDCESNGNELAAEVQSLASRLGSLADESMVNLKLRKRAKPIRPGFPDLADDSEDDEPIGLAGLGDN